MMQQKELKTIEEYKDEIDNLIIILKDDFGRGILDLSVNVFGKDKTWLSQRGNLKKIAGVRRIYEILSKVVDKEKLKRNTEINKTPANTSPSITDGIPSIRTPSLSELALNGTFWIYNLDIHEKGVQVSKLEVDMHQQPAAYLTYINRDGLEIARCPLDATTISAGHVLLVSHNDDPLVLTIVIYLGLNNTNLKTAQGLFTGIDQPGKPHAGMMILQKVSDASGRKVSQGMGMNVPEIPARDLLPEFIPKKILHYLYNPALPIDLVPPEIAPLFIHNTSNVFNPKDLKVNLGNDYMGQSKYEGTYWLKINGNFKDDDVSEEHRPKYGNRLIKQYPFEIYKHPQSSQLKCRLRVQDKENDYKGLILNRDFNNADYIPVLLHQDKEGPKNKILFLLIFKGNNNTTYSRLLGVYSTHERLSRSFDQGHFVLVRDTSKSKFEEMEYTPIPLDRLDLANHREVALGNFLIGKQPYAIQQDLTYYETFQAKGTDVVSNSAFNACKYAGNYAAFFYIQDENGTKGIARNIIQINAFYQVLYWGQKQEAGNKPLVGSIDDIGNQNLHLQISGKENDKQREISYYVKTSLNDEKSPILGQLFTGVYAFVTSRESNKPVAGRVVLQYLSKQESFNHQAQFIELPNPKIGEDLLPTAIWQALAGHTNNLITFPRYKKGIISKLSELKQETKQEINMGVVFFRNASYLQTYSSNNQEIAKEFERAILHGYGSKKSKKDQSELSNIQKFVKNSNNETLEHIKSMQTLIDALERLGIKI